jgi:hypothetical protein
MLLRIALQILSIIILANDICYHEILAVLQEIAAGLLTRPPPDPDAATWVDLRG